MKKPPALHFRPGEVLAVDDQLAQLIVAHGGRLEVEQAGGLAGPMVQSGRGGRGGSRKGTAVIPVSGFLTQHVHVPPYITSTEAVKAGVAAALEDSSVSNIVLAINSGGGQVMGVPELAAAIRSARAQKPVLAAVNSFAASAAYYIASACSRILATPSGELGSVGVYMLHIDASKALEAQGLKVTMIARGTGKTWGNPYEPLAPEALADSQQAVDRLYNMFVRDVAAGRGLPADKIRNGWGARAVGAEQAVSLGMADAVAPFDEVLALAARSVPATNALSYQEECRMKLAKHEAEDQAEAEREARRRSALLLRMRAVS